jgi:hypothetical protein
MGKEQIPFCICPFSDHELRFGESACVAATGVFIEVRQKVWLRLLRKNRRLRP